LTAERAAKEIEDKKSAEKDAADDKAPKSTSFVQHS